MNGRFNVDVSANRTAVKWSRTEQAGRVLWACAAPLFRLSPRPFWGWRRGLLRLFGARVGAGAQVYPTACITMPWNLDLGAGCAVASFVKVGLGLLQHHCRQT